MDRRPHQAIPTALPARVLFGAAYYNEYQPYERLARDLDLMARAGFSVIRVGESVWSSWEPRDGVFDLEWLAPVLDGAHERGIAVILGTPTYAFPPWLRRKHPELTAHRATGTPIPYGHRQDADFTHPAFLHHAARLVRRIVGRYADHPAIIGYQVDNEPGMELLHNPGVHDGFVEHLQERYGDVEEVNARWGLTYWSHRLSRWSDLWPPDGNTAPGYDLAWRRFQAQLTHEFIHAQVRIVRELARPEQFVTTCLAYERPATDMAGLCRELDVTAVNPYYAMQDALSLPQPPERPQGGRPEWLDAMGTWWLYLEGDIGRGIRQEPFLVTETGATSIGESHVNFPAYDGQWRQAAWAFIARGARMIEYWHWHSLHYGNEAYWGGVLGHSLEPGRCYEEIARIGAELRQVDAAVIELDPEVDVAFLRSYESKWAMEFQPPLGVGDGPSPDRRAYERIFNGFYRGAFDAGLQAAVVFEDQLGQDADALAARWPVLVAPGLYVAGDDLLALLNAYARAGGHLVLGFRAGYADEDGQIRAQVMPGPLREGVGASYGEFTNLSAPVPVSPAPDSPLALPDGAHATAWADGLVAEGARALACYEHPHLRRWPAITSNAHGAGRVTYVGTLPDAELARALASWLVPEPANGLWGDRPASVTVTGARGRDGRRLRFVSNWSWDVATVPVPVAVKDLLSGDALEARERLALGAWDVRVLVERDSTTG
jgi:beta-galactosidase